jgi:hypothetical protein
MANQWHPTKNGALRPLDVRTFSGKKIWWICARDHEWQAAIYHRTRNNSGCPVCAAGRNISIDEQEIADYLTAYGMRIIQSDRSLLSGAELDIYIPEKNLAIEFNGVFWHSEKAGKGDTYHYDKWIAAKNVGIQLIQIWEDEWKRNPKLIKTVLLHKLSINTQDMVSAQNTVITILAKPEAERFLNTSHVNGFTSGSHYLGLYNGDTNSLITVMVLKKQAGNTLNIVRYATSKHVVGGFTKLLSYAEQNFSPDRFVGVSDHCVSNGELYENNGFTVDKELAPDYRYVVKNERRPKSEYSVTRFKDDPNLKWQDGLTEKELADLNGIPRIWDAGKTRWVKTVS